MKEDKRSFSSAIAPAMSLPAELFQNVRLLISLDCLCFLMWGAVVLLHRVLLSLKQSLQLWRRDRGTSLADGVWPSHANRCSEIEGNLCHHIQHWSMPLEDGESTREALWTQVLTAIFTYILCTQDLDTSDLIDHFTVCNFSRAIRLPEGWWDSSSNSWSLLNLRSFLGLAW